MRRYQEDRLGRLKSPSFLTGGSVRSQFCENPPRFSSTITLMLIFAWAAVRSAQAVIPPAPVSETYTFRSGWNLFSFYYEPASHDPNVLFQDLLQGVAGQMPLKIIYHWQNTSGATGTPIAGEWETWVLDTPKLLPQFAHDPPLTPSEMTMMSSPALLSRGLETYQAYWLYIEFPAGTSQREITFSGPLSTSSLNFKRGWNLMGLPLGSIASVRGNRTQVDFESILRGTNNRIDEVYSLDANGGTGFYPAEAVDSGIQSVPQIFIGEFVSGKGNWFLATEDFSLEPKLRTVLPPDTDVPDDNLGGPPGSGDVDRNRVNGQAGIIENGDTMTDVVFRFQPYESLVEEVIPLTISNRGTEAEAKDNDSSNDGQGVLAYKITWHPYKPNRNPAWDPNVPPPDSDFITDSVDDIQGYPKDSPYRTWLKVLLPTETHVMRPDGRVDPVVISRARPIPFIDDKTGKEQEVKGFISSDIAGITLVADRTGLPINTDSSNIDANGAPKPYPDLDPKYLAQGELRIHTNDLMHPVRRIRVRCEVPPLSGTFEGKALISKINGVPADPAFSVDLSLSLFEDGGNRLRGVIDSERVLLYPRDVPLTGSKLTATGSRYVFTGSFFLNPGDINRFPFDRYTPTPSDDGVNDVDQNGNGKLDRLNPLPYDIERSMIMYVSRESDLFIRGEFTENVGGLTPLPLSLEGSFELLRASYEARKRKDASWTNPRIIPFDATGSSPTEELRSTIVVNRPLRIDDIWVDLGLDHPRLTDLRISLQAPDLREYRVFPIDDTPAGSTNFDGESAYLYESFTSASTPPVGSVPYKRERTRRVMPSATPGPQLSDLKGLVAGNAVLYGNANLDIQHPQSPNVPSVLDSSQTACLARFSALAGHACDPDNPSAPPPALSPIEPDAKVVRISTWYFAENSADTAVTDLLCSSASLEDQLSSGDPLAANSVVSVLVRADANPAGGSDAWMADISSYQVTLTYPPQLLEFLDARAIPSCPSIVNFPTSPQKEDDRSGTVRISGTKTGPEAFRKGALFAATFRVKSLDDSKSIRWNELPASIPRFSDPEHGVIEKTLNITGDGQLIDLDLGDLNVTHPAVGDLKISLIKPNGTSVVLMDQEGGDTSNIVGLTFDDSASASILGAAAPFTGRFRPQQALSKLFTGTEKGSGVGVWRLRIENSGERTGKLTGWGLDMTRRLSPNYSISVGAPPTLWTLIVRDNQSGPEAPLPIPRLIRWGLRIRSSGGQILGTVLDDNGTASTADDVPLVGAKMALVGREVIPETGTLAGGTYTFDTEEFGLYTITASKAGYEPTSTNIRFFESDSNVLKVPPLLLHRKQGTSDPADYSVSAMPTETWVRFGQTAPIRLELTVPSGTAADAALSGRTFTFRKFDGTTTTNLGSPAYAAGKSVYDLTPNFAPGAYLITVLISGAQVPSAPTGNIVTAPVWLIVRSDTGQSGPDGQFWWINRYSFASATSNQISSSNPVNAPGSPGNWNYYLRDAAGFDIDRPSKAIGGAVVIPTPRTAGSNPGAIAIHPQDSDHFIYNDGSTDLFPDVGADGSHQFYPRNFGGTELRWRAFLSFNSQVVGTAYGTSDGQGLVLYGGEMPLFVDPPGSPRPASDLASSTPSPEKEVR